MPKVGLPWGPTGIRFITVIPHVAPTLVSGMHIFSGKGITFTFTQIYSSPIVHTHIQVLSVIVIEFPSDESTSNEYWYSACTRTISIQIQYSQGMFTVQMSKHKHASVSNANFNIFVLAIWFSFQSLMVVLNIPVDKYAPLDGVGSRCHSSLMTMMKKTLCVSHVYCKVIVLT